MREGTSEEAEFQPDRFIEDLRNIPKTRYRDAARYTETEWRRGNITTAVQNVVLYIDRLRQTGKLQEAFGVLREIHPEEEVYLRLHLVQQFNKEKSVFTKNEMPVWIREE